MRKYLLLFTELSGNGGIQVYSRNFLNSFLELRRQDYADILVLGDIDMEIKCDETKVRVMSCKSRSRVFSKIKFILLLFGFLLREKPDFVFSNHINLLSPYMLLSWVFRKPYSFIAYGIDVWQVKSFLQKMIIKRACTICSISEFTREKLVKHDPSSDIFILSPAVDTDKFTPKDKNYKLVQRLGIKDKKVILTVARFVSYEKDKGYDKVIRLMPLITKSVPDAVYVLAGGGDNLDALKQTAKQCKVQKKVIFTGEVPDNELADYYNLCDVFVMPSKQEGFGIVFLEALACGKTVITGNADGSREAVLKGEIGVMVDPENPGAICSAIVDSLQGKFPPRFYDKRFLREKVVQSYGLLAFKTRLDIYIKKIEQGTAKINC